MLFLKDRISWIKHLNGNAVVIGIEFNVYAKVRILIHVTGVLI